MSLYVDGLAFGAASAGKARQSAAGQQSSTASPAAMATIEDATDNASAELRATLSTQQTQLAALQQLREILNAQVVNLR